MQSNNLLSSLIPEMGISMFSDNNINANNFIGSAKTNLCFPNKDIALIRKYDYSDPVKFIDWKAYARSHKLLIRQSQKESAYNVCILIGNDPDMYWPDENICNFLNKKFVKKIEIALKIGFNIAFNHIKNNDKVDILIKNKNNFYNINLKNTYDLLNKFEVLKKNNFNLYENHKLKKTNIKPNTNYFYYIDDMFGDIQNTKYYQKKISICVSSPLEENLDWIDKKYIYFCKSTNKFLIGKSLINNNFLQKHIEKWKENILNLYKKNNTPLFILNENTKLSYYFSIFKKILNLNKFLTQKN